MSPGPGQESSEIPDSDKEEEQFDMMVGGGQEEDEGHDDAQGHEVTKRDYIIDLFPYTRPVSFYTGVLTQVLGQSSLVVLMTTSAHPGAVLAARAQAAEVIWLVDRPRQHSIELGREIMRKYWKNWKTTHERSAQRTGAKRALKAGELQLIEGPTPYYKATNTPPPPPNKRVPLL